MSSFSPRLFDDHELRAGGTAHSTTHQTGIEIVSQPRGYLIEFEQP
jgi:hypothetical protein